MDEAAIELALDACYDAIVDSEAWGSALHRLARAVDAAACVFHPRKAPQAVTRLPASPDHRALADAYVLEGWYRSDYRLKRGWPLLHRGRPVIAEHELATEEERQRSPIYNELYRKFDFLGWAAIAFWIDHDAWSLSLVRARGQGVFSRQEIERLTHLAPHLRRMVNLTEKLADQRAKTGLDVLDRIAAAAMMLSWRGAVAQANAQAEALMGDGLAVVGGRLVAADRDGNRRLQGLIDAALAARGPTAFPAEPIAIARPDKRPLMVEAVPVAGLFGDVFHQARVLVLVTDLDVRPQTSEQRLQTLLGLSPAEAKLVAQLGLGEELNHIAERLGITRETARSHVKSAFAKTGTHRQAELIQLATRVGSERQS